MPRLTSFGGSSGFGKTAGLAPIWISQSVSNVMTVGIAYTNTVSASLATSYFVSFGTLPAGLSLNSSTGVLSGTPTTAGAFSFRLGARNRDGIFIETATISGSVTNPSPTVTGGTLYSDNTYYYRKFTSSGTLAVSNASLSMDILAVGGGGSGFQGAGGAGGILYAANKSVGTGSHTVTVGAGGSASNGSNTTLLDITANGGGHGATGNGGNGNNGGSGGGSGRDNASGGQKTQTNNGGGTGYGNNGGNAAGTGWGGAGGGGGAGAAGGQGGGDGGYGGERGGNGGIGLNTWSTWASVTESGDQGYFAGGGGTGTGYGQGTQGQRGLGGGGAPYDQSGYANTGGGGSTAYYSGIGNGNSTGGGSGIVIVRYLRSAVGG